MIDFYFPKSHRIVRTFQDADCATGDVKMVDEHGRVWVPCYDSFNSATGEIRGRRNNDRIIENEMSRRAK